MLFPESPVDLYEFQEIATRAGYSNIIGVDEVGRGPLAGPVVAAAVKLPDGIHIEGLRESKQLSPAKRERLYQQLINRPAITCSVAAVSPQEIDRINIRQATHLAMRNAVLQLKAPVDFIFVDGLPVPNLPSFSQNIIKGDTKSACIAAASVVAKVYRDKLMTEFEDSYPGYGFKRNKGYGTKEHIDALRKLGPCTIHRRSFAPVANAMHEEGRQPMFSFT